MAISHANHDHPNTPAARRACRQELATEGTIHLKSTPASPELTADMMDRMGFTKSPKWTVKPSARSTATANRLAARASKAGLAGVARERHLRVPSDIPVDCPAPLHFAITRAWENGWDVIEGYKLNDMENRILIAGTAAQVSIVWNAAGFSAVFTRRLDSSITRRADSVQAAMAIAAGDDN